jgi:hypothetical protein
MTGFARVLGLLMLVSLIFMGCSDRNSVPTTAGDSELFAAVGGNGAPNGAHYNLNIIGVPKDKTAAMDDNNGHRIFVRLWGNIKIMLAEGDNFRVLDANGTDGNGAKFQLPDPDPDDDMVTTYSVYARALGIPGGWSNMNTGFVDEYGDLYYSLDTLTLERGHGNQKFTEVSQQLLTIYADINDDGIQEEIGLFDDDTYGYFWNYDNHGLKLVQLRFYEIASDVSQ